MYDQKVFSLHFYVEVRKEIINWESMRDETSKFVFSFVREKAAYIIDYNQIFLETVKRHKIYHL